MPSSKRARATSSSTSSTSGVSLRPRKANSAEGPKAPEKRRRVGEKSNELFTQDEDNQGDADTLGDFENNTAGKSTIGTDIIFSALGRGRETKEESGGPFLGGGDDLEAEEPGIDDTQHGRRRMPLVADEPFSPGFEKLKANEGNHSSLFVNQGDNNENRVDNKETDGCNFGGAENAPRGLVASPVWQRVTERGGLFVDDSGDTKAEEVDSKKNVDLLICGASSRKKKSAMEIETVDLTYNSDSEDDSSPGVTYHTQTLRDRRPSWALDKNDPKKSTSNKDGKHPSADDHSALRNSPIMAATMRQKPAKPLKHKKTSLSPEDELLNKTGYQVSASAMPAYNEDDVDWVDTTIYMRSTADGSVVSGRRTSAKEAETDVPLTQQEIQEILDSMENRPGHFRKRKLVSERELRRESEGDLSARVDSAAASNTGVGGPVTDGSADAEVDIVELEKQGIAEAADRLGLRSKRKVVTRREEIVDEPGAEVVSEPEVSVKPEAVVKSEQGIRTGDKGKDAVKSENVEGNARIKPEKREVIIVAEGPDGRPRRFRRVDEVKTFYRVPKMTTPLLDHQILGVDWMLNEREWGESGLKGGMLADQMGLGKTMQAIATMVLNPPPLQRRNGPRTTLIVAPTALLLQWAEEIERHTKKKTFDIFINHGNNKFKNAKDLESKDVVITSYASVMRSYPNPKRPRRDMSDDEVEEWWNDQWENYRKDFHRVKFWRVILDESHVIKNPRSRTSMACTSLQAVHKWAISGTPIQNTLLDMYPIFRLLGHRFSDLQVFHRVFGTNSFGAAARGAKAMQVALAGLMMRRNKDHMLCGRKLLDLTPKLVSISDVTFSPEERALYRVVEKKTIDKVNELRRRSRDESGFYLQTLVLLLRLRQVCNHPYLIMDAITKDFTIPELKSALEQELSLSETPAAAVTPEDSDDDLPENPFSLAARRPTTPTAAVGTGAQGLRRVLKLAQTQAIGDTTQCAICLDVPEDAVMTGCRHVFCQGCIMVVIQRTAMDGGRYGDEEGGSKCPLCQRPITEEELRLYNPRAPRADDADRAHWLEGIKHLMPSAKMTALVEQMRKWREEKPDDKIIIFSQFTKMLDLIELTCDDEGWETTKYTGGTSLKVREASLKRFRNDPDCMIMLISLRAGGVGLNLTDANLVISVDMWWNVAVEYQAFDRVHRLGQTKEVEVVRFMVKETVEHRIRALQEKKLTIADAAMGEGLGRVKGLTRRELMGLFGKIVTGADGIDMIVQED